MKRIFMFAVVSLMLAGISRADIVLNDPEVGFAAIKVSVNEIKDFKDQQAIEVCFKKFDAAGMFVGNDKRVIENAPAQTEQIMNETTQEYETVIIQAADPQYTTFMANWTDCVTAFEEHLAGMLNGTIQ